jgi:hypothetical protein
MTQVKLLLDKTKQIFLPKEKTVFDFTNIYECWVKGKCTTQYLHDYCMKQIALGFIEETERRKK